MSPPLRARLTEAAVRFLSDAIDERGGRDPVAALYFDRRASFSLFSLQMNDADCEALRPYLFGRPIPRRPGERPATCLNLVDGAWARPSEGAATKSLADRRVTLCQSARSPDPDCFRALYPPHAIR